MSVKKNSIKLKSAFPSLWAEIDSNKNDLNDLKNISFKSSKHIWWKCSVCGWEWFAPPNTRVRSIEKGKGRTGCKCCAGRILNNNNNLNNAPQYIIDEWDYIKNTNTTPKDFFIKGNQLVWWLCSKCLFSWRSVIYDRTCGGCNCPSCSNHSVAHTNTLSIVRSDIAKEWDFDKNFPVKPEEVCAGGHKKYWWVCSKCGYKWNSSIYYRTTTYRCSCPACNGKVYTESYNLAKLFPDIADDWDYIKNMDISPDRIMPHSNKKVWWLCRKCCHSYKDCVYKKVSKYTLNGIIECTSCSNKRRTSYVANRWLDSINIPSNHREKVIKCYNRSFVVDGYDPANNTVYEFLGDYWHGNPHHHVFSSNKLNGHNGKTFKKLYQDWLTKKKLLEDCGYKVVFIWESDFIQLEKHILSKYKEEKDE